MNVSVTGNVPRWHDPLYLRSHIGLLLHWNSLKSTLTQGEPDISPKNLVIARQERGGWRLFCLTDAAQTVRPREAIIASLNDPSQSRVLDGITVEPAPGQDAFSLRQGGHYLSSERKGELGFVAPHRLSWEIFEATRPGPLAYQLWRPAQVMGGTQLMHLGLSERLGKELNAINLQLHRPDKNHLDHRPLVIWFHNDVGAIFDWCTNPQRISLVAAFVFVSGWQLQRFLTRYPALPAERCHVIRNATDAGVPARSWPSERPWRWRCAYTSAPNRGLTVLLDAWDLLDRGDAELHIWSSFRLWGQRYSDTAHHQVLARARRMTGVTYHGIRPNAEVRSALQDMHFLTYPAIVDETSCIAVIEAMAAGLRVVTTASAALPETSAGFARLYTPQTDRVGHAAQFAQEIAEEFLHPWDGMTTMAAAAQDYARRVYSWAACIEAWRDLIGRLMGDCSTHR